MKPRDDTMYDQTQFTKNIELDNTRDERLFELEQRKLIRREKLQKTKIILFKKKEMDELSKKYRSGSQSQMQ